MADGGASEAEGFAGADLGGLMKIDDDLFRLGVLGIGRQGDRAVLQILHRRDQTLNDVVEVELGSVFDVGHHRLRVVTLAETSVAIRWARGRR